MAENYYKSVYSGEQIDTSLGRIINGELDETVDAAKQAAGQAKVAADEAKASAEKTASDVKVVRAAAEAEGGRVLAEEGRVESEADRVTAEEGRVEAEEARETSEEGRVQAENARAVWEEYDPARDYVPGNKVAFNGSSYLNVVPCRGVLPTDEVHWLLIARRGVDGEGAGDMLANVYDPTGKAEDVFGYADQVGAAVMEAAALDAAEKAKQAEANAKDGGPFLPLAGGTLEGQLKLPEPTDPQSAVSKGYVDDRLSTHAEDAGIHVTEGEKQKWNSVDAYTKQESLSDATKMIYGYGVGTCPNQVFARLSSAALCSHRSKLDSEGFWGAPAQGNGMIVAILKKTNKAVYSEDGENWAETTMPYTCNWHNPVFGEGCFASVKIANSSNVSAFSKDGKTWAAKSLPYTDQWGSLIYICDKFFSGFVAIGSQYSAYYDENVGVWKGKALPLRSRWESPAYRDGVLVTIDYDGNIIRSTDGTATWSRVISLGEGNWAPIIAANGAFFALQRSNGTLHRSTDNGMTWREIASPTHISNENGWAIGCEAVNRIVLVSREDAAYSDDLGESWSVIKTPGLSGNSPSFSIFRDGVIIVTCEIYSDVMCSSDNGVSWKSFVLPAKSRHGGVADVGGKFMLIQYDGQVLYSYDGYIWLGVKNGLLDNRGNPFVVTGSYTGSGSSDINKISLGFRPSAVIIAGNSTADSDSSTNTAILVGNSNIGKNANFAILEDGFSVRLLDSNYSPSVNAANKIYDFIAFR